MIQTPAFLNLPRGSVLVEDPDEEIFLLYTRKLQLAASSSSSRPPAPDPAVHLLPKTDGLGFAAEAGAVVPVTLTVTNPWIAIEQSGAAAAAAAADSSSRRRTKKKRNNSESKSKKLASRRGKDEVTVEVELHQSLDALRHRKGDTGSVLWRLSLHLAQYLLRMHHFPAADPSSQDHHPALLPSLAISTILELGSGTGFLGIALRDVVLAPDSDSDPERASGRWLFSDQWENLPLVMRNLRANRILGDEEEREAAEAALSKPRGVGHRTPPARGGASSQTIKRERRRVEVLELDWLAEAVEWDREQQARARRRPEGRRGDLGDDLAENDDDDDDDELEGPLVLLAVDCIYNPSLSAPLAKTLLRQARLHSSFSSSSFNARRRALDSTGNDPGTVIVVVSELRDEEALEAFLKAWSEAARKDREEEEEWTIARLGWDDPDERRVAGELASSQFVTWVAWKGSTPATTGHDSA